VLATGEMCSGSIDKATRGGRKAHVSPGPLSVPKMPALDSSRLRQKVVTGPNTATSRWFRVPSNQGGSCNNGKFVAVGFVTPTATRDRRSVQQGNNERRR